MLAVLTDAFELFQLINYSLCMWHIQCTYSVCSKYSNDDHGSLFVIKKLAQKGGKK